MYTFTDKSGSPVALRPEGTAGVVRAFINSSELQQMQPVGLYYVGPMFRYERPQKGRTRQFHQIGVEFLGGRSVITDITLLEIAHMFLQKLNLRDKVTVRISLC